MTPRLDEAAQLLAAGDRDRLAFRILNRDPNAPEEILLFHAQQAAEKFIKAVLAVHGIVYRRTHDLLELAALAERAGLIVPADQDLLIRLGPYAVEFRYFSATAPTVEIADAEHLMTLLRRWAAKAIHTCPH
jgi:HEPN domain-containing protein